MTSEPREDPMRPVPDWRRGLELARACRRCGARTRRGTRCQAPAMRNGRCRLHGGKSTGPRTPEGIARIRAARTTHGGYSAEARAVRWLVRELRCETAAMLAAVT